MAVDLFAELGFDPDDPEVIAAREDAAEWCLADSPDEDDETELRTDAVAIIAAFVERGMSELP